MSEQFDKAIAAAREALKVKSHPLDSRVTKTLRDLLAALDAARGQAVEHGEKLWLWKHRDHFLAFKHEYPCFTPGGDPMTLGPPFGYALFQVSHDREYAAPPDSPRVERYGDGVLVHWPEGMEQYVAVGDCVTAPPAAAVSAEDDSDEVLRELSATLIDRSPERHKAIERTLHSLAFYRKRCELMQSVQSHMRDPERTLVCDILANGQLLGSLDGTRYAPPAAAVPEGYALVPVEPTTAMKCRAVEAWEGPSVYKSMFARGLADLEDKAAECWAAMLATANKESTND